MNLFIIIGSNTCKTVSGGPRVNISCVFPFKFRSDAEGIKVHYNCIEDQNDEKRTWCSTKVDEFGFHKSKEENWGYCQSDCKGLTKHEDEEQRENNAAIHLKVFSEERPSIQSTIIKNAANYSIAGTKLLNPK